MNGGIPQPGEIIAGKYQVERVLGRGGMGVVVAAWHTALRQRVAIKFLLPEALPMREASGRFLREAQSASAITSEHVARVLDVGTLESGSPYIIMEYLTGTDLSDLLKARGALPINEAVDYILQACEAIAEAHALGIIHRDLKPGNLFRTKRADGSPLIKVLDFGLSKAPAAMSGADSALTATTTVVGSPHYMSPEQMRSLKRVDHRTDIWSLGVILYQMLAGRRPFEGESLPAVFGAIAADQPASIQSYRADVPVALERAVFACLEKDLSRRTQSIADFAEALRPFGSESAALSLQRISKVPGSRAPEKAGDPEPPPVLATTGPDGREPTTTAGTWRQSETSARSNRLIAIAAGALGLFILASTVILLLSQRRPSSTPAQSTDLSTHPEANGLRIPPPSVSEPAASTERATSSASADPEPSKIVEVVPSVLPSGSATAPVTPPAPSSKSSATSASATPTVAKPPVSKTIVKPPPSINTKDMW